MPKFAAMFSASALLLGLAAASANAQTQTGASLLRAMILNASPVALKCPRGKYWLCKGEGADRRCSWKCY
jgi:hypothetical protein